MTNTNKIHLIFFHGITYNHKRAIAYVESLHDRSLKNCNISVYAHEYTKAFQSYTLYFIISLLLIGAIITSLIVVIRNFSVSGIIKAVFTALIFTLCSIILLIIPFMNINQGLIKSSIEHIESLIDDNVEPKDIVLYGHSFGGAAASETLKYFINKDIVLGGIIFNNTFSSFEAAIRNFRSPQTKILSILPSSFLDKVLRTLNLEYDIAEIIKDKASLPIIIINSNNDNVIPKPAQLATSLANKFYSKNISIYHNDGYHDEIMQNSLFDYIIVQSMKKITNNSCYD
ncbi:alpha/beta hydrolase [Wolbachia endosymbiont of Pentidionis agamae]|uniref:alpha/beta hydrolase n=1 Tax=Wolbachia endosymbiont of Pentidionis agamae TaxID=3110435 RepID=UPI002FD6B8D8